VAHYDPNRLKQPLKRTNPRKGIGVDPGWKEIGWDEALDEIAAVLRRVRAENPRKLVIQRTTTLTSSYVPMEAFTGGLDPLAAEMLACGGSFAYTRARLQGGARLPLPATGPRPMTLTEKILAQAARRDLATGATGLPGVAPGDGILVKTHWRLSHEGATPLAAGLLERHLGPGLPFRQPDRILAFQDHLAFLSHLQSQESRQSGMLEAVKRMKDLQTAFCRDHQVHLHGANPEGEPEGISHVLVTDRYVLPGEVVVGTDSHTCHAGALGALALGVGAAQMACAWITGDVPLTVPPTTRVLLRGRPGPGVSAKDVVLHLLTLPALREGRVKGHVLEFQGEALQAMDMDERATLTNMASESGALTGLVAPDAQTARFIRERRGFRLEPEPWLAGDPDAAYAGEVEVDCSQVRPMAAAPGHPGNGVAVEDLPAPVAVDLAYVGSCTGGKLGDIQRVHQVVRFALDRGLRVPLDVQFFIQLGSEDVRRHAQEQGWLEAFEEAGARILHPGCGACINAGPGVSTRAAQVTISAVNRNLPGRSGPGQVWLASPETVAASAFQGIICTFQDLVAKAGGSREEG
jgi:3-isopropylmalate/(R)-2-methylmalate dehydratase large subunit